MSESSRHPETLALHAGWRADPATGAVAVPIYQTTSYQFREHRARREPVRAEGARQHLHPHHEPDDRRAGEAHRRARGRRGGAGAWPRARRPRPMPMQNLARPATISSARPTSTAAPGTCSPTRCKDQGIEVRFVDPGRPRGLPRAPPTTAPAPTTPRRCPTRSWTVFPIAEVAAIGRPLGIPLIMDNTAAPLLVPAVRARRGGRGAIRPPNIIGGHGTSIGGIIVDGGNFDWEAHRRAPAAAEHARSRATTARSGRGGQAARARSPISCKRARRRCCATSARRMSPFNAFLILQGLETLPLRMRAALRATPQAVADFLPSAREVTRVIHPVARRPARRRARADSYLHGRLRRPGRLRAGGRRGGRPALHRRAEAVLPRRQHRRRAQPGHPSGHRPRTPSSPAEEQLATGVTPGYVRLSVGIEHIDDILADLESALGAAGG